MVAGVGLLESIVLPDAAGGATGASPAGGHANTSRRKLLSIWGKFLATMPVWNAACSFEHQLKWIAFYGERADEKLLSSYDIVVLDPAFRGSIDAVGDSGAIVCAYLSLGEISKSNRIFGHIERAALLD